MACFKGNWECRSGESFHPGPFLRQAPFDELPLALRRFGLEQPAVADDVVAVRS